jgi:hypothetical protein
MAKNGKRVVRSPVDIKEDGFSLTEAKHQLDSFAMLSLRIALKSYFATYRSMSYCLDAFTGPSSTKPKDTDYLHSTEYCTLYGQVIVHCQHFAELVCKDFLRDQHPLLAINLAADPVILLKLAKNEEVAAADHETLNSVEFREGLERVLDLLKAGQLDPRCGFVKQAKPLLESLNRLRNRLLHRGTFILRYRALDELVGAC